MANSSSGLRYLEGWIVDRTSPRRASATGESPAAKQFLVLPITGCVVQFFGCGYRTCFSRWITGLLQQLLCLDRSDRVVPVHTDIHSSRPRLGYPAIHCHRHRFRGSFCCRDIAGILYFSFAWSLGGSSLRGPGKITIPSCFCSSFCVLKKLLVNNIRRILRLVSETENGVLRDKE